MEKLLDLIFWVWWKWENHTYGGMNFANSKEFEQFKFAEWRQQDAFEYPNDDEEEAYTKAEEGAYSAGKKTRT